METTVLPGNLATEASVRSMSLCSNSLHHAPTTFLQRSAKRPCSTPTVSKMIGISLDFLTEVCDAELSGPEHASHKIRSIEVLPPARRMRLCPAVTKNGSFGVSQSSSVTETQTQDRCSGGGGRGYGRATLTTTVPTRSSFARWGSKSQVRLGRMRSHTTTTRSSVHAIFQGIEVGSKPTSRS